MSGNLPLSLQQSFSARRRRAKILPIDIDQFLVLMAEYDNVELGAYLRVLVHYWQNGSLPENSERLAKIMRILGENVDTPSITRSITTSIEAIAQSRADWIAKRKKAHDKAVKAVNTRWARYRQMKSEIIDTPSTTSSTKKERFPHTPSKEPSPYGGEHTAAIASVSPHSPMGETRAKEEVKAKPVNFASRQTGEGVNRDSYDKGTTEATYPPPNAGTGHFKNGVNPASDHSGDDPRFDGFRKEVSVYWEELNPRGPKLPWIRRDTRALNELLAGSPNLRIAEFRSMLEHRAGSEDINPLEPPHNWLRSAVKFAASPLDRYGKPRKLARTL